MPSLRPRSRPATVTPSRIPSRPTASTQVSRAKNPTGALLSARRQGRHIATSAMPEGDLVESWWSSPEVPHSTWAQDLLPDRATTASGPSDRSSGCPQPTSPRRDGRSGEEAGETRWQRRRVLSWPDRGVATAASDPRRQPGPAPRPTGDPVGRSSPQGGAAVALRRSHYG